MGRHFPTLNKGAASQWGPGYGFRMEIGAVAGPENAKNSPGAGGEDHEKWGGWIRGGI